MLPDMGKALTRALEVIHMRSFNDWVYLVCKYKLVVVLTGIKILVKPALSVQSTLAAPVGELITIVTSSKNRRSVSVNSNHHPLGGEHRHQ